MNNMEEQYRPTTAQEVAEYDALVAEQKAEELRNARNGRFILWLIVSLFAAAAICAALAS
jgi:hypothetical protein